MRELTELQMRELTRKYKPVRIGPEPESERGPSKVAAPSGSLGVARGWVPVSSAEALAAEMRAKGVSHHKLAVAARRRGAYSVNARHRAASSALLLYAYKLRRLVEDATVRQPAPNDKMSNSGA